MTNKQNFTDSEFEGGKRGERNCKKPRRVKNREREKAKRCLVRGKGGWWSGKVAAAEGGGGAGSREVEIGGRDEGGGKGGEAGRKEVG